MGLKPSSQNYGMKGISRFLKANTDLVWIVFLQPSIKLHNGVLPPIFFLIFSKYDLYELGNLYNFPLEMLLFVVIIVSVFASFCSYFTPFGVCIFERFSFSSINEKFVSC